MIRPQNHDTCTIIKNNDVLTNGGGTEIAVFTLNCGLINVLT